MSALLPLRISIHPKDGDVAKGSPVQTTGDLKAFLESGEEEAHLSLLLPDTTRTEIRWMVDRVVRGVRSTLACGPIIAQFDRAIDRDTAEALALDFAARSKGEFSLLESPELSARVAQIRPYEELFKSWVNEDPTTRTSLAIARDVEELAETSNLVSCEILAEDELAEKNLNLLLAVGGGSEVSPPRLVLAHYRPPTSDRAPLMLLGKGITFDTGGINVKPYESFVSMMKNDMAGAGLAFALFKALVEGNHPHPVSLVIPTCENSVGARSMRPGSLVTGYRGIQVRIDHTDAEGRLVLADGLAYASDTIEPDRIICFATLTTAALVGYGPFATPVHFAPAGLEKILTSAGEACGEDLHFFPERIWHLEANRDKEADLKNTARLPGNAVRGAGSRNAAHFLKPFTERELVHLDIFGSTWNWSGEAPGSGYGATGAPIRSLLRALRE